MTWAVSIFPFELILDQAGFLIVRYGAYENARLKRSDGRLITMLRKLKFFGHRYRKYLVMILAITPSIRFVIPDGPGFIENNRSDTGGAVSIRTGSQFIMTGGTINSRIR